MAAGSARSDARDQERHVRLGRRAGAVQDLNVNAALNGEQLTIEQITGNVATGGVVGSFSAKGSAKFPS
jgi:autotransporter translocation and assembly factor TamB